MLEVKIIEKSSEYHKIEDSINRFIRRYIDDICIKDIKYAIYKEQFEVNYSAMIIYEKRNNVVTKDQSKLYL